MHGVHACVSTGEGRRCVCVWMSVSGEEVEQASAPGHLHLHQNRSPRLSCTWLRLALRGGTQGQTPAGAGHVARGRARAEGDVGGLGRGSSCGRAETRHCHGSGWGRSAKRRPRSVTRGREPATLSGASGPCFWAGRGGSTYLDHGRWVLKAWSHRWQGPAAGESSSASSVPGPRAHRACSTKRHSKQGLKGEGGGRDEPDPQPQRASGGR